MGFSVTSAIRFGWETFKKRPWFFIGAFLLIVIAQALVEGFSRALDHVSGGSVEELAFFDSLVSLALSTLISMGVTAFALAAHDNPDTVGISALWHPRRFWKYLVLTILFSLIAVAGFLLVLSLVTILGLETGLAIGIPLIIVFGVIVSLTLIFAGFLVIERALGPIAAMRESARITRGHRWALLGLLLLLFLINLLGLLAFIVGVFVSAPVSLLAVTRAYRVLSGSAGTPQPADAVLA